MVLIVGAAFAERSPKEDEYGSKNRKEMPKITYMLVERIIYTLSES